MHLLEINDLAVTLSGPHGPLVASPGVAVADRDGLHFGADARARARRNPRRTFDRFWEHLDQQPLAESAGPARSHADLAYYHLRAVLDAAGEPVESVTLAVPAEYDKSRLALALGVVQACGLEVAGLVCAPVAAAVGLDLETGHWRLLGLRLHDLIAADIEVGPDSVALTGCRTLLRRGLVDLENRWAGRIAERFVRDTRFDPLHDADTEQRLHDALDEWLTALADAPAVRAAMRVGDREYHVPLDAAFLAAGAEEVYRAVAAEFTDRAGVVLDARLAALPGLREQLPDTPVVCPPEALASGVDAVREAVRADDPQAPPFVTRLPRGQRDAMTAAGSTDRLVPTHLLSDGVATPLPPDGHVLAGGSARLEPGDDGWCLRGDLDGLRLNGRPVAADTRLVAGDHLAMDDRQMWLIAVAPGHGQA